MRLPPYLGVDFFVVASITGRVVEPQMPVLTGDLERTRKNKQLEGACCWACACCFRLLLQGRRVRTILIFLSCKNCINPSAVQ